MTIKSEIMKYIEKHEGMITSYQIISIECGAKNNYVKRLLADLRKEGVIKTERVEGLKIYLK